MCSDLKGHFPFNLSLIAVLILATIFLASLNAEASSQPILEIEDSIPGALHQIDKSWINHYV